MAPPVTLRRRRTIVSGLTESVIQAQRLLLRWSRMPEVLIQALVFPAFLLLVFKLVLGDAISSSSGQNSVYGYTALVAVTGAIYGALSAGLSLHTDRETGLLARLWTLPIGRSTGIIARLIAECVRALVATIILFILGMALGLRAEQGFGGFILALLIPVILTIGIAALVTAITLSKSGQNVSDIVGMLALLGIFFSTGFAPTTNYPEWLRLIVEWQPMSCGIDAIRGLLIAGPVAVPVLKTVAWSVVLAVGCGVVAVRGYRNAARGG